MTEPFQLLQINIISARDLAPVSKSMHTYVVGWVNPNRKLTTQVDHKGNNCPEWNDRFVFRVTPKFLNSDSATIEIEIYSQAWLRDALVGSVRVAISNLLPTGCQNGLTRRSVALQIRRPSGRPQGILNVAVSVLDGTRQSMPLSGIDLPNEKGTRRKPDPEGSIILRRVKSERSWTATTDQEARVPKTTYKGHDPGPTSSLGGSICNSDVGPSASIVAAAVAKGLYMPPMVAARGRGRGNGGGKGHDDEGSSILQWEDERSEEGVMTKIERWKMELQKPLHGGGKGHHHVAEGARHKHRHRRSKTEGGRLFRCFGKAYGFELTIVCGANHGNDRHNNKHGKKKVHHTATSDGDTNSQSYIII